ncbi:MAG: transcription termination/antitermination factor NusG [Acidimicrobiaceae bacterium]|nr:transcription termination/antitermination factor NusG [Acidimicrobiaceae bacterium]
MSDSTLHEPDETVEDQIDVEILDVDEIVEPEIESAFDRPGRWYIVHTFAGHEKKVISALQNIVKSRELSDQIYEIYLPEEDVTEFKSGKKVTVSKRMFPSYLLVRCEPDPEIFYVIGSTPGVTGFVGAEKTRPTALTRREVDNIIRPHVEGVEQPQAKRRMATHEFEVNDTVQIKTGPFATFSGHVAEINEDQMKVKVLVDIFGRETPVELDFTQITKL